MAKQNVGRTALGAATCRMIEQYQPAETRLLDDPVVKDLVGPLIRFLMQFAGMRRLTVQQTDAVMKGLYGSQICRTRFIDDVVKAELEQGIDQIVILGAGLDTRPYRLPGLERVKVFEVDLPSVQDDKKDKIQKHFGRLPGNVTFIPIDFDRQTLDAAFAGTAFDPARPAVYVWEGVTQYITQEAVSRTLAFVGKSAPGSSIVFTYILKSVIERRSDIPKAEHMMDTVAKTAPFIFGLEPTEIPAFLKTFHLDLIADVGNADYQEKYLKPLKRSLVVSEVERIVHAEVLRN
jgi:methyltransferase (TIGR00027 family)